MSIKIVVDSASDLTQKEAEVLGITVIPMEIIFPNKSYYDGVDLSQSDFYQLLDKSEKIPSTSQINEFRFDEAFENLTKDGSDVLCITMSSKLSGTYQRAVFASQKYNGKVLVVDSLNVTIGERILIQYAVSLVNKGLSLAKIKTELDGNKHKIQLLAFVGSLKYLRKGGRLSSTVAVVGEILNIKPLVSIIGGEVKVIGKALGIKKAISGICERVGRLGNVDFNMPFALGYTGNDKQNLTKFLNEATVFGDKSVPCYRVGCTIGAHIGSGGVALSFFSK